MKAIFIAAALIAASIGHAAAQISEHDSHAPAATTSQSNSMPAHARENAAAMDKMHGPMMKGGTVADPDEAFVRGMIPHHQGAIDMARVVLKYGKDEQAKKWASDVIRDQQREISEMEAWLRQRGR